MVIVDHVAWGHVMAASEVFSLAADTSSTSQLPDKSAASSKVKPPC
jgi:hypothetical protein